ncbi:helix-turn-helix domain containing protein [Streptomyces albipurpureus]|uniref:Helix-turn-helix domain containing protein n=1 Tax=Streptomyces albipurpureus TaxID=2897419 RepID=A0ABT0USH4_9ACTN|nr:helix-turn-helix domain containing protein [Streptomyces sp. CWNU-1]MCM2390338.1 helix-turn-helix domain containing protein [Streptomyces sp. CWNU-1]
MNTQQANPPDGWQREGNELVWNRAYGPWLVTARCPVHAPFNGPSELTVRLAVGGTDEKAILKDMDQALETDGIPASLLRQIPLAEIKAEARAALSRQEDRAMNDHYPVPARCHTEEDYALLVAELARMRATGTTAPQGELAANLGIGKATMSERIKRSKELGLWDGRRLTEKAHEILIQWRHDQKGS